MRYTCPKCGKHIELSAESLIASEYRTVCPQCLSKLEIIGEYAYVPTEERTTFMPVEEPAETEETVTPGPPPLIPEPPQLVTPPELPPAPDVVEGYDPLLPEVTAFLVRCSAITPMMIRDAFGIPLERAQAIIQQLERQGVVGPYAGGAPRQILIPHNQGLPSAYNYGKPYDPATNLKPADNNADNGGCTCSIWLFLLLLGFLIVYFATK